MFLDNKYTKWYFKIIEVAKTRTSLEGQYYEKHHITPKSLGGNYRKVNTVSLTPREHFVCHRLLYKMLEGEEKLKMGYALWCFTMSKSKHKLNSRTSAILKANHSALMSTRLKGKTFTEEHKLNISKSLKGTPKSEEHRKKVSSSKKGKFLSEGHKLNLSKSHKGIKVWNKGVSQTIEHKNNIAKAKEGKPNPMLGKKHSIETRQKMSEVRTEKARLRKLTLNLAASSLIE